MISEQETHIHITVAPGQQTAVRLDAYITMMVQNATRNKVQQGIKDGWVLVNDKQEKPSYKVQGGDEIHITLPKPPPPKATAEDIPLDIIFEDEYLLVINKAAGMVVHPAYGNWSGTLVNAVLHHVKELEEIDSSDEVERLRPGIVHRLDKDTSGVMVVAKDEITLAKLSELFSERDINRTYHALVWGFPPASGTFVGNIGRSKKDRKVMAIVSESDGKHAVTHYKKLDEFDGLSLLELTLETGRTHQIRVHCSHYGYPVFGDQTYGGNSMKMGQNIGRRKQLFEKLFKELPRQALHAKTLGFVHPRTGEELFFESELPADFTLVLDELAKYSGK